MDSAGTIWLDAHSGQQQAAGVLRHYLFIQGTLRESNFVDDEIICAMPKDLFITEGWQFNIADSVNVSAADTFICMFQTRS